jgi:phosphoglucomutase
MEISALAGKPAAKNMLVDLARLEREYYERRPDIGDPDQLVSFGTSGHRGSSLRGTFTESHILAITQAAHLKTILNEAQAIVNNALQSTVPGSLQA